jgi:hypothetical protein
LLEGAFQIGRGCLASTTEISCQLQVRPSRRATHASQAFQFCPQCKCHISTCRQNDWPARMSLPAGFAEFCELLVVTFHVVAEHCSTLSLCSQPHSLCSNLSSLSPLIFTCAPWPSSSQSSRILFSSRTRWISIQTDLMSNVFAILSCVWGMEKGFQVSHVHVPMCLIWCAMCQWRCGC